MVSMLYTELKSFVGFTSNVTRAEERLGPSHVISEFIPFPTMRPATLHPPVGHPLEARHDAALSTVYWLTPAMG